MLRNSTIRQKKGICEMCSDGKEKPLTKGLCETHYWFTIRLKSVERLQEIEVMKEEGMPELIARADEIVSKYVRMSSAVNGYCDCYTCDNGYYRWQDMHCGHFIPRANLFTRFDVARNLRVQCPDCNIRLRGNRIVFARKLNEEKTGLADLLIEESAIVYKPSREEIKVIIVEYSEKLNRLKKAA